MSIDKAVADLVAALNANTAALTGSKATAQPTATTTKTAAPATKPASETKKTEAKKETAKAPTPPAGDAVLTQLKKAILELAERDGREAAIGALTRFGVMKVPELKANQYPDVLAHVQELLAAKPGADAEGESDDSLV